MPKPTRRLFFALWPDDEIREEIATRRERLGRVSRQQVPDHNLHLTLVFIGDRPDAELVAIERAADGLKAEAFDLVLDRFGWFARAGVVWLGGEAPDPMLALAGELGAAMAALGIELDPRPFRPHVTLFRKVRRRPELPEPRPLHWPVREFALVESISGRPYQVLRTWPLESSART
ncbi:RNA 2',3'-cyclic phosphodiesterase [Wenzhouxiangella sp. EGI_FJ10409]|uniref:RNA 2',3'-cyclic phosphodiesterase n=1 Tax=Wenzhouxiangella sp. EGI_FJ10409 TaxID=3243767 RepID=UPI0035E066B7